MAEIADNVPDPSDVHLKALHEAILDEDLEKLQSLCSVGLDLNRKFTANIDPQHAGITPVALASALSKIQALKMLLDSGADVNEPFAALNTTALMTSAYHGHAEVVQLLLSYKADVRAVDLQQSTALGYAFGGSRSIEVVRMLLNSKVDVNQRNMLGMNSLLLVAGYGNEDMVGLILGAGADPASVNDFGHTALHLAVVGKRDLLTKLRQQHAAVTNDPNAADNNNSLNRRDLDVAVQEWARTHKDTVGNNPGSEEALARAGRIMMSIGHQLEDTPPAQQPQSPGQPAEDTNDLERRVRAMRKYRQEKLKKSRSNNKSGLWTLLCGSSKSAKTDESVSRPYAAPPRSQNAEQNDPNDPKLALKKEENKISESFGRILRMLISSGCDVHRLDVAYGMTALDLAILIGDVESTAVLAAAGADPSHFLKMLALKDFYIGMISDHGGRQVRDLLTFDEDLDINMPLSRFTVEKNVNDEGLTPLALAVRLNDLEAAKLILKRGADINKAGPAGRPPLCEASTKDNKKMVDLLLQQGADIEKSSPAYGDATPLTIAVIGQRHQLVEMYIKKGAKVDRPMRDGKIPLYKAIETNDVDMVALLLSANIQKNFMDKNGLAAELAGDYQKKDRDPEAILARATQAASHFESSYQPSSGQILPDEPGYPPVQDSSPPRPDQQYPQHATPSQMQQAPPPQHSTPPQHLQETPPRPSARIERAPDGEEMPMHVAPSPPQQQTVIEETFSSPQTTVIQETAPIAQPTVAAPAPEPKQKPAITPRTAPVVAVKAEAEEEEEETESSEEESGSSEEESSEEEEEEEEQAAVAQAPVVQAVAQAPVVQAVAQAPVVQGTPHLAQEEEDDDDEEEESSSGEEETESSSEEEDEEEETKVNGQPQVQGETDLDAVDYQTSPVKGPPSPITHSGETTL